MYAIVVPKPAIKLAQHAGRPGRDPAPNPPLPGYAPAPIYHASDAYISAHRSRDPQLSPPGDASPCVRTTIRQQDRHGEHTSIKNQPHASFPRTATSRRNRLILNGKEALMGAVAEETQSARWVRLVRKCLRARGFRATHGARDAATAAMRKQRCNSDASIEAAATKGGL